MATNDDYLRLRRMTGEVESPTYTDTDLELYLLESSDDFNVAAATIWAEKASAYADLVNITEAGSSRNNSDLFKHAKEQADHYAGLSGAVDPDVPEVAASTTRRIVRP